MRWVYLKMQSIDRRTDGWMKPTRNDEQFPFQIQLFDIFPIEFSVHHNFTVIWSSVLPFARIEAGTTHIRKKLLPENSQRHSFRSCTSKPPLRQKRCMWCLDLLLWINRIVSHLKEIATNISSIDISLFVICFTLQNYFLSFSFFFFFFG